MGDEQRDNNQGRESSSNSQNDSGEVKSNPDVSAPPFETLTEGHDPSKADHNADNED
jgi:hypothetical protein